MISINSNKFIIYYFSFCLSFILCGLLIFLNRKFDIGRDKQGGIQKFHSMPTSRLGGIAIGLNLICLLIVMSINGSSSAKLLGVLLISTIPVYLSGTFEDITNKITPATRLLFAIISSTIAYAYLGVCVYKTDVFFIDWLLKWSLFSFLITVVVVAGFTHSINIIDGFNGLASGQILIMLSFLSFLNYSTQQYDLLEVTLILLSATLGFFLWNWPNGKIFLGDGGAYLLGFLVVCLGLLLISRSPQVSPFAPILLGIYPLIEALFSMYRRFVVRGHSVSQADALHLHSLIFRRIFKRGNKKISNPKMMNSLVSPGFWISTLVFGLFTCLYYTSTSSLLILFFTYITIYVYLFLRIVRFKTPKWLFIN